MEVSPPFGGEDRTSDVTGIINPTELADFTNLFKCPQFYKYKIEGIEPRSSHEKDEFRYAYSSISPVFEAFGSLFENTVIEHIEETSTRFTSDSERREHFADVPDDGEWTLIDEWVTTLVSEGDSADPVCLAELFVVGTIGSWRFEGYADLVCLWIEDGVLHVRVLELKSGFKQKTSHRLQATVYATLLDAWLDELCPDGTEFEVSASIVTRDDDISDITHPSDFETFQLRYPQEDIYNLTKKGGSLDELDATDNDVYYQLSSKCRSCPYLESCYANTIENADSSLLGLTRAEQRNLAEVDANSVHQFATLTSEIQSNYRRPNTPIDLKGRVTNRDSARFIDELPDKVPSQQASELVEKSQVLLSEIEEDTGRVGEYARHIHEENLPWKAGSGYANLPQHDENLARVYLHVENDHRYDRLCLLSAYITVPGSDPRSISEMVTVPKSTAASASEVLSSEDEVYDEEENKLVTEFTTALFDGVGQAVEDVEGMDEVKLHFYFFADTSQESFVEALERHSENDNVRTLRHLLDERGAIRDEEEQSMSSVVQPELTKHRVTTHPTEGILPIHDMIGNPDPNADWGLDRVDSPDSLREAFEKGLFDYKYDFDQIHGNRTGIRLNPSEQPADADEGYSIPVSGSQIPIEYIWSASGRISIEWISEMLRDDEIEVSPEGIAYLLPHLFLDVTPRHASIIEEEIKKGFSSTESSDIDVLNSTNSNQSEVIADSVDDILEWMKTEWELDLIPIEREDVTGLAEQLAAAIADIEEDFDHRDRNVTKQAIDLSFDVPESHDELSFERALKDFLLMEYETQRRDNLTYYWQKAPHRLQTGKSILVEIEEVRDRGAILEVEVNLPYDKLDGLKDPNFIMNKIRAKEEQRTSSGSYMVANKVMENTNKLRPKSRNSEIQRDRKEMQKPESIEDGALTSIVSIDFNEQKMKLTVFKYTSSSDDDYFTSGHWFAKSADEVDEPDFMDMTFEEGEWFILDPNHDDITSDQEFKVLNEKNNLLNTLDDIVNGYNPDISSTEFDTQSTEDFVSLLKEQRDTTGETPDPPNESQDEFITRTDKLFNLLQGPPGTGKTQTLGNAIGGRVSSKGSNGALTGAIVGPSNKSVDESLEATAKTIQYATEAADGTHIEREDVANTLIVRIVSSSFEHSDDEELPIVYVNNKLEMLGCGNLSDELEQDIKENGVEYEISRRLLEKPEGKHIVIFGTSSGVYKLIDQFGDENTDALFNLAGADESSMLRLPGLLVPGAELSTDGQVLVCGDQRQMPPIQHHNWDVETRYNTSALVPHLPSLDYLRLLKGHGIRDGKFEGIDVEDLWFEPGVDIGMTQLILSYRCEEVITKFLNAERYWKEDKLDYQTADEKETLTDSMADDYDFEDSIAMDSAFSEDDTPPIAKEAAREIFDPETSFILIKHDEMSSRQLNKLEVHLTRDIIRTADGGEDGYNMGVVTPHNSQRSSLEVETVGKDWVKTDTVERFQGGEKDLVLINATESDPDYLSSQSEFILNPNRITVALSRMKHKVALLASQEIFELIPKDVEQYEDAELWKGLHASVRPNGAAWEGTAGEFSNTDIPEELEDYNLEIFVVKSVDDLHL